MERIVLTSNKISDDLFFDIINREAALWVCADAAKGPDQINLLARFMLLPWKIVLCESSDSNLVSELENLGSRDDELSYHRGFVHILTSDPSSRKLPARMLPVFMLNGRDDAHDRIDSPDLPMIAATRRKLNMIGQLESVSPKKLVVIGTQADAVAKQLAQLWLEGLRSLITFVVPPKVVHDTFINYFDNVADISTLAVIQSDFDFFANDVIRRCSISLPDTSILLRIRNFAGELTEFDVSKAELIEQPIFDKYDIIKSRDLRSITKDDLTLDDINVFFDKNQHSWRAYAAGLPWNVDSTITKKILNSLHKTHKKGSDFNTIFYITSEPGAGGTTIARKLGFDAAVAGYPTIIARPQVYEPNATEIISFINRTNDIIKNKLSHDREEITSDYIDTPWFLIFDRDHWDGQEYLLANFLNELKRSGRSVVILKVIGQTLPTELFNIQTASELCTLSHELTKGQVFDLGDHLNKYLATFGNTKSKEDWIRFWEEHKPDIDTSISSFWIALEFWLRGLIDLGESIQAWILRQFKTAPLTTEMRLLILEIATLSTERRSIPEYMLPELKESKFPLSVILNKLRNNVPGIALVRQDTIIGRCWAIAHDVLGRYLINGIFYDRNLLDELQLSQFESSVEIRLYFISKLTRRSALGEIRFLPYAVQFAIKTLKLDETEGNAEFFQYWKEILNILEEFPKSVTETSRAFNHHVAISRRRVANSQVFGASDEEKRIQLKKAIAQIVFSLNNLNEVQGDESNLNLYNSLALAYQDLYALEVEQYGLSDFVLELRKNAHEATLNALRENPSSPFVLETAAKNLLQQGQLNKSDTISSSAEALGYIFQATKLETSGTRQFQLSKLANEALQRLNAGDAEAEIKRMIDAGNPMGFLASAWCELTKEQETIDLFVPTEFSETSMRKALEILSIAPKIWILLRLEYDLISVLEPMNFKTQIDILDELDSFPSYQLPLQLRLERSILLHLIGRHPEANNSFRILRGDIKRQNAIVVVPERLRWLLNPDLKHKMLCNARVTDDLGYRPMARVTELKSIPVPFIAQDFGSQRMLPGQHFKCYITFGAMGPFIKAPVSNKG